MVVSRDEQIVNCSRQSTRLIGRTVRDDARHNALIISKKKYTQRYEDRSEITVCKLSAMWVLEAIDNQRLRWVTDSKGLPVRPWMELVPPVMMVARIRSVREMRRGAGSGISIASLLTTPGLYGERLREEDCLW